MSTSLDGKITGPYMETAAAQDCFEEYERVNQFYQPQAWINGRLGWKENYVEYAGRPKAYVIEILTEAVSDA